MATEDMQAAANTAIEELEKDMAADPKVAEAVKIVGAWIGKHYLKAGYKLLCRGLLTLIK